jgi:hypothetical protein
MSVEADQLFAQRTQGSFTTQYQMLTFVISQLLTRVITTVPVRVVAVTGGGSLESCPYVNVQPLLKQKTGNGQGIPHGVVYNVPCWRMQAGGVGVVLDPAVGDIGLMAVAYRDSSILVAQDQADPGTLQNGDDTYTPPSNARYDWGSGFYLGGWLNGAVSQYLQLTAALLKAVFPSINLNGVTINSSGDLAANELSAGNGSTGTIAIENSTTTITVANGIITGYT